MKKRFFIVTLLVLLICYCASAGVFAETRRSVNSEMSVEYSSEIPSEVAKLLEDMEEEDIEETSEEEDSEDVDTEDEDTEEDIESEDTDEEEDTESEEDFETVYDWGENLEESEVVYQWEDIDETTEDVDSEEDDSEDIDVFEEDADDDSEEEIADADSEEDVDEDIDSEEDSETPAGVVSIHYPHVVTNGKMVTITEVSFATEDQAFAWIANHLDVEVENIVFYSENGKIVEIVINSNDFEEVEEDVVDEPATTSYAEDDIFTDIAADEVAEDAEETTEDVEDIEEVESEASEDEDTSSNTSEDDGNSKKNVNKGLFIGDCKPEYPETYSFSAEEDPSED